MSFPPLALAANRRIGLRALEMFSEIGWRPIALLVPDGEKAECVSEMKDRLPGVPVFEGQAFRSPEHVARLRALRPDYLLSVHFPYMVPAEVLAIPAVGTLNLHPAYLPYNRGWHTPTWAICEGTPYGATLHWVDEGVDTGDLALQERLDIQPDETAHELYQRVLELEVNILKRAIPLMRDFKLPRVPQPTAGTGHSKKDIQSIQRLDLSASRPVAETIKLLRALTTNQWSEAAYFDLGGERYRIRVEIKKEES